MVLLCLIQSFSALKLMVGCHEGHRPVKSSATTVFLAHHDSVVAACCLQDRNTYCSCYCHKRDAALKSEGKATHAAITVLLAYFGSMLSPVSNTVILQCFDAVGWVTGRASGL